MSQQDSPFMDMIHGAMARMNDERKARSENMRLGTFIDALEAMPSDMQIEFDVGCSPGGFTSYRGYYEDLAFIPISGPCSVGTVLVEARRALGEVFHGYKGGDFPMHRGTLLWVSPYGDSSGVMITGVDVIEGKAVVKTAKEE